MSRVLDTGALIALEQGDRELHAILKRERVAGRIARTHGGVVGQVWRGGGRQANLARALRGIEVVPLDDELGRRVGVLLGDSQTSDVIDAAVVLLARAGDVVYTSDIDDLRHLAEAAGSDLELVRV